MARTAGMDDLFGHVAQRAELALESAEEALARRRDAQIRYYGEPVVDMPVPPGGHTAETIRPLLEAMLAEARATVLLTWSPVKLRHYTSLVPYMAEWLKGGEGDRLQTAFKVEMDRLDAPAEHVAPNWRRIWGLPGDKH